MKRDNGYTEQTQMFPSLLLCKRGEYNHRSQTTISNLQGRCSNSITETTMNSDQHTPKLDSYTNLDQIYS